MTKDGRQQRAAEQSLARDEMAQRISMACQTGKVKVVAGSGFSNVFVVEDRDGVKYTVTVARSRRQ